ncbi:hypothetical protein GA0115238_11551, partial [Streptomyces sp. di50b]
KLSNAAYGTAFRLGGETPPLPCSAGVSFLPREREVPPPRPEGRGIHERNQMTGSRTFDGRTQLVEYKPRVLERPPLDAPA